MNEYCCKCKTHVLPFERWREEQFNLVFCNYCKQKLFDFFKKKYGFIPKWYEPTDEEIENYIKEFLEK